MKRRSLFIPAFLALCAAFAAGCATTHTASSPMPTLPSATVADEPATGPNPGSLYSEAESDFLFSDSRARKVGDVVLVNIVENSKATNKADTTAERENEVSLGVSSFFGKDKFGIIPFTGANILGMKGPVGSTPLVGATSTSNFKSTGETKRESTVTATVAARVVRILPGGLMQVEGGREVRVNDETQILVVRGLVRPRDIASDNTISSTHLADAQIQYFGKGVLADKQRPGWLSRILDNVWPF